MSGKLYVMGVGPGASDLITVRAARILARLDVIYAPSGKKGVQSLAHSIVEEYLSPETEVCTYHFLMKSDRGEKEVVWDRVAQALQEEVAKGRKVGFITLGDPMLFSTWVFLLERIGNPPWLEIVPGITSFAAIAARSAMPLAMENQTLSVIAGTAPDAVLEQALLNHDCIVLMKVYSNFERIRGLLQRHHLLQHALMMADATLPTEQCWHHLGALESGQGLSYFSTILVNKNWQLPR
ncbi:cobalt-factor II C(20)-methyltransferase [Xenorhabdus bovienii]|uniref:cobalt-factor II C(20)-methyltransferase n=1 Tax=Xenorhabdus bovienii TaxID=40576 RepID=UPI0023B263C0|nr:cobalt-factor II C(20)-methyltransferase [Xenorhabdus bovienii]MDE9429209.1 cobalt-factor II C(20)-methyltransferase [Xenorhabdus bovienii]MDE9457583.1 cobalt-factor II C(20)-methyltransferase [Xenorhabdus bovienii]MDE9461851.1 cobalt-factor II C(20)-methyltransferase [Xenorhabdus bovienii]MDE9469029.1 cobalt-factor II C(20)-methyltransferase [Xenorhabdus bovienii]MDE9482613.1 cobalt-factor II C(20)-methyltransferase [Xenorhabdus bovienii]